ncbi:MAG: phosphate ABC transporter permease subunit PstC [Elusimicrobia bacterium RIFCSPHIGHO2_02_FULL_57_9]|nr:MAG: phosphate ABC transporter permease subunit PstC [Elusimicrobia bacterium RIFCSPHIGHO2_02_FULL_57_9]
MSRDRFFKFAVLAFGLVVVALAICLGWELLKNSHLAWSKFGLSFLYTSTWDPVQETFGALPFIYGTLVSSALALTLAVPLALGSAIFLTELAPRRISQACAFLIELLAAIPSVVLGLIGIFILVPGVRAVETMFQVTSYGVGMLAAGLILSIMVLPYITSISREVLMAVPQPLKEGMLALGATRWEMIRQVSLPYARSGIIGAVFLALGRALGETMAVTMVIGNTPKISASLLDPSYSMAAVIANELAEATSDIHMHSLIAIALVLFGITMIINGAARLLIDRLK